MKILVAENWPVHEECLPAWICALNLIGIYPDVLVNKKAFGKKGNVFDCYENLKIAKQIDWDPPDPDIGNYLDQQEYDLIIVNSFQGENPKFYLERNTNIIGIVHHYPELPSNYLSDIQKINNKQSGKKVFLAFLWDYIQLSFSYLHPSFDTSFIKTMYPLVRLKSFIEEKKKDHLQIAIPGGINPSNRNYIDFLKALSDQKKYLDEKIKVNVVGGGKKEHINYLLNMIAELNVSNFFSFLIEDSQQSDVRSLYTDYYAKISSSDMIAPLFKQTSRYRDNSISSAVAVGYSASLPIALNSTDSYIYNLPYSMMNRFDYKTFFEHVVQSSYQENIKLNAIRQQVVLSKLIYRNTRILADVINTI
jgi:glycosyltransferase involved in cell wall biosynthesis